MNYGPGWVIFEEFYRAGIRQLVSILSPRRTSKDISAFIEQLYIDRHGSIRERLEYKKSRKAAAYTPMMDGYGGVMHCGHEPYLVGVRARKIVLRDGQLEFTYLIATNRDKGPLEVKFEERQQSLAVGD
jgi:hypothetical protein